MTRSLLAFAAAAALALAAAAPAQAASSRRQAIRNQTRVVGGPSAIGGVTGSNSSQMVRAQQQRARRGAGKRRMSPREQLLAARDRQLGVTGGAPVFSSRHEAAMYTRLKARTVQLRTFAVAVAAGIGGGFLAKLITVAAGARTGFRELGSLANDPNFGNVIGQVIDGHFAIGAAIGAGVALVAGSIRAAQLRRRADAIERGEVDLALVD